MTKTEKRISEIKTQLENGGLTFEKTGELQMELEGLEKADPKDKSETKEEVVKTEEVPPTEPPTTTAIEKKQDKKPAVILNRSLIKNWQDSLLALPSGLSATPLKENRIQVEVGFAAQLIRKNTTLQSCSPTSIYDAIIFAARIGLTLNPAMGLCHLVPRKGECCLDIDYKGWIAMCREYGLIKDAFANMVYEDEEFERRPAENIFIHHPKDAESEELHNLRKIKGAYSILVFPDGTRSEPEWIAAWELEKIAKVSPAYDSKYSPRKNWRDEMHKKGCFKRHIKKFRSLQTDSRIEEMFEHEDRDFERPQKKAVADWATTAEIIE